MQNEPATGQSRASLNLRGFAYLACAFFFFSSGDVIAKVLTAHLHPIQIVWARQAGLMCIAMILLARYGTRLLQTSFPKLQIIRGTLAVLSAVCFILALRNVPLADAVTVTFIAPFLVTVLGALLLREHVSPARWVAIALGFAGALIIIRPGLGVFHPTIFLVVLAACFFALRQVLSRTLSATDNTLTTLCYTAIVSFAILCIPLPFVWEWPESRNLYFLMAAMSLLSSIGEILVIRAFEVAEAVVVAPMHYSLIIWATFYGWLIFDQLPDIWTWIGTAVIFATGIFLVRHERRPRRRLGP